MIVDLRLDLMNVLIVGGGREATKRATLMATENCSITVVSPELSDTILDMAGSGQITTIQERADVSIVGQMQPDVVVAATDDATLNQSLVDEARRYNALGYSSSNTQHSDYAHLAQAEFGGVIKVAVSTGGRSPVVAKIIRDEIQKMLGSIITPQILQDVEEDGQERLSRMTRSV